MEGGERGERRKRRMAEKMEKSVLVHIGVGGIPLL